MDIRLVDIIIGQNILTLSQEECISEDFPLDVLNQFLETENVEFSIFIRFYYR